MKKRQLEMFATVPVKLRLEAGRNAPRFWVKRLVVWEREGVVVREVKLRRGLNIVWSPDGRDGAGVADGEEAMGHGAGKTLFCRLLRYCLGEKRAGPIELMDAIAREFPDGMVGVEVVIDGREWAAVRSLGRQRWSRAAASVPLESLTSAEPPYAGYAEFTSALEGGLFANEVSAQMPERKAWPTVLAWLTRDQECRFGSLVDWRSAASDSDSHVRHCSATTLHDVLRAMLRLSDADEQQRRREVAALVDRCVAEAARIRRREQERVELHERLCTELQVDRAAAPDGQVGIAVLRAAARQHHALVLGITPTNDVEDLASLRSAYERAQQELLQAEADVRSGQRMIDALERELSSIRGEVPGTSWRTDRVENPHCELCEVPVDRVLATKCMLSHKLPDREQIERRIEDQRRRLALTVDDLAAERARVHGNQARLGVLREAASKRRDALVEAERRRDARGDRLHSAEALVKSVDQLERWGEELDRSRETLASWESQRDRAREQATENRKQVAPGLPRLQDIFNAILQRAIHHDASASINLHGKGTIELRVRYGGDRSTAAIDSLKVVAFDLAAMLVSVEGATHAPAFLLHDSPREADLGESRYHGLIRLIAELEPAEGEPLFQYILTTTTRPPEEMIGTESHRATLHGTPASERLLRRDL